MKRLTSFCAILFLFASPAFSQIQEANLEAIRATKIVTAVRISEHITLDGRLEEQAWQLATAAKDFSQRLPTFGAAPTEPTEFRILYDDDNLYFGVTAFDSGAAPTVVSEIVQDFNFFNSDVISIVIDSLRDRRSGFGFVVNPA